LIWAGDVLSGTSSNGVHHADHGCRCWKVYGCSGDFILEKRREEKFASQEECSSDGLRWSDGGVFLIWAGDVLSGTSSNGVHHAGISVFF